MLLNTYELSFDAETDSMPLLVSNLGEEQLSIQISSSVPWLKTSVSHANINESGSIDVIVDRTDIPPGLLSTELNVYSNGGHATIHVSVFALPKQAELSISNANVSFEIGEIERNISIATSTPGCAEFRIVDIPNWMFITPTIGNTCGSPVEIKLFVNRCFNNTAILNSANLRVLNLNLGTEHALAVSVKSETLPSTEHWISVLEDLPQLPKPHLSWPAPDNEIIEIDGDPLLNSKLFHYVRITGGLGISSATDSQRLNTILKVLRVVKDITNIEPRLAVNYSPWPANIFSSLTPEIPMQSPEVQNELGVMLSRFEAIKETIYQFNLANDTSLRVTDILFDSETWRTRSGNSPTVLSWNEALEDKQNHIIALAKSAFGSNTATTFYRHGEFTYTTFGVQSDRFSFMNYHLGRPAYADNRFFSFLRRLQTNGVVGSPPIESWLALGQGWVEWSPGVTRYVCDLTYPEETSYDFGLKINRPVPATPLPEPIQFAEWERIGTVIFYPHPFSANSKRGLSHFLNYVLGATQGS